MKTAVKHYKFINSKTGNIIYYHSFTADLNEREIKAELEKVKAQVAAQNSLYLDTLYWEKIKDDE
jgi:hypothetical protein